MGQTVKKLKSYSADFKKSAALEVLEDQRGVRETARKYSVNHCMWNWPDLYAFATFPYVS